MYLCVFSFLLCAISCVRPKISPMTIEEIKAQPKHLECNDGPPTACKPVTPPCFLCTTPPYSQLPMCSNPPVTFKFENPPITCPQTCNPCKPSSAARCTACVTANKRTCCRSRTCTTRRCLSLNSSKPPAVNKVEELVKSTLTDH